MPGPVGATNRDGAAGTAGAAPSGASLRADDLDRVRIRCGRARRLASRDPPGSLASPRRGFLRQQAADLRGELVEEPRRVADVDVADLALRVDDDQGRIPLHAELRGQL